MKTLIKLFPIIVLIGMVSSGMDILIAAFIGLILAVVVCHFMTKSSIGDIMNCGVEGAKEAVMMAFVMMLAYAVAEVYMATGVGASAIRIFINLGITGQLVAVVAFLTTCMVSVATGTAWGTFAACFPIFIWLSNLVGGAPALTFAASIAGSIFGDNIGLISDTTILSSAMQGVKVSDRVKSQGAWSLICVAISAILFYATSVAMGLPSTTGDASNILSDLPAETWAVLEETRPAILVLLEQVENGVPVYMVLPIFLVVGMAIKGIDTIFCLSTGIVASIIFGIISGTVTSITYTLDLIQSGFESAGSWAVIMLLWAMAFGAVMREMDAFRPITVFFLKISHKVRHLLCCNGLLCIFMNATLNEDVSQIATVGPIIKEIVEENVEGSEEDLYKSKTRNALFSDSIGVMTGVLIPWHSSVAYYLGLAIAIYPLYEFTVSDMYYNYFAIICLVSIFILTFFRLDRFLPGMGIPSEPDVKLKSKMLIPKK